MHALHAAVIAAVQADDPARLAELLEREPGAAEARDADGISAILHAVYRRRDDLVALLLVRTPSLDIFEAAALGEAGRVTELLDRDRALVRALSPDGYTPLHLAAYFGHADVARRLLRRGADVHATSRNALAVQPLHSAAAGGHGAVVQLLLKHGANAKARQAGGFTPLHAAAANGDTRMVRALIAHGAEPVANDEGQTPRDLARARGHTHLARHFPKR
jgi:uncharacterized protein